MENNLIGPLEMQSYLHNFFYHQYRMNFHYQQQDGGIWSVLNNTYGPKLPDSVEVYLDNKDLWDQFHAETTEMIITKTGRRMFPSVQVRVAGLDRRSRYCVLMELAQASSRRHKYVGVGGDANGRPGQRRGWTIAGPAEQQPPIERRLYIHPDSPASGAHWMLHPLNFNKLKLTNNVLDANNNILLTSMHKYNPRIWIIRCDNLANLRRDIYESPSKSYLFKETEFIAVTAYQNENITKLKIDNNPFAKGFRETGQSACKRKRRLQNDDPSNMSEGEEEGNVSSDSDSTESAAPKRARSSETDAESNCSVSSSDRDAVTSPDLQRENTRPRLHRPWCDNENEATVVSDSLRCDKAIEQQQAQLNFLNEAHSAQYHLMAFELAKMRQTP
ncbi:T-box transcription factor TBX3-like [Phymastichus coffea]|uniref:T-box transcription factor TBX3-like n=1 Tax=Phymastichus coffea TaxID=108790 RepID=UPI00273C45FF|nr:T-box transcription factor TBX3-like [Phymastichus coffea]